MTPPSYDARLADLQRGGRLPSVSAAVAHRGEPVWCGVAGLAPQPASETSYRIGSITKTMTAVLVLQLVEAGLVGLDDPVGRHVPTVPHPAARIGDLLAHTAGLPSEPTGDWWERSDGPDRATLFARTHAGTAPFAPGHTHHYSNLGYALLGAVVEEHRQMSWWHAVQQRLLRPLEMTATTYHPPPGAARGTSIDHFTGRPVAEPHTDTRAMAPAGQLWSTPDDLLRWAQVLAGRNPAVLDPDTAEAMRRPRHPARHYGLGARLVTGDGRTWVGHTGSMPGFQAALFVDDASGDAVAVLANATTGLPTDAVPERFFGPTREPDPLPATWCPSPPLPEVLDGVPGMWFWGNTAFGLEWWGTELRLRDLRTGTAGDRFALGDDGIVGISGYHDGEQLVVHRDVSGAVTHLVCATFVYTRTPYDPRAPIPGGVPSAL